ncbi:MAG: septal ring lytic transglycosylase RlpA family protein [Synechococcales bacterium]|nr:septal ring lytic transglycosylase RlpA family protein [Synechococcales bacterium]
MNQRLWSGLTAALLIATLGVAPSSQADEIASNDENSESSVPHADAPPETLTSVPVEAEAPDTAAEVVKVGEYQSDELSIPEVEAIATVHGHVMDGRQAATLYVRGIPVLTFLGDRLTQAHTQSQPLASAAGIAPPSRLSTEATAGLKMASQDSPQETAESASTSPEASTIQATSPDAADYSHDPVWRATAIAAQLNQFHRDGLNSEQITAHWDEDLSKYVIRVNDTMLVEFDERLILPDTTGELAEDVLQATNRIRRQMGGADPLSAIEGAPQQNARRIALGPLQFSFSGMASWYGPGFHGRRSASGEVFNQHALTAAHRSLPFGTLVEVTNLNNGMTVVVRVNDRGPFSRGRVIDLSAAAARAVGMMQSGVAPVQVNVLGATDAASQPR